MIDTATILALLGGGGLVALVLGSAWLGRGATYLSEHARDRRLADLEDDRR